MRLSTSSVILALTLIPSLSFAANEYTVDSDASSISFATIKKSYVVEPATLGGITGNVDATGNFSVTVPFSSLATGVPIRDERLNNLFFEAGNFPMLKVEGTVSMADLDTSNVLLQKPIPAKVTLFGNTQDVTLNMNIIKSGDDIFAFTYKPVIISSSTFGIPEENLKKVSETVENIAISDTVPVNVSLVFREK